MSDEDGGPEYWKRRAQRMKTRDLPFYRRNFVHLAYATMIAMFVYTYYLPFKMIIAPPKDFISKQLDPRGAYAEDPKPFLKRREALDRMLIEDLKEK